MPRIKLQANKLENPKVSHISLVSHGANRIPFRIVKRSKQEHGMIDLMRLFKQETPAGNPAPAVKSRVLGVVVEKSEHLGQVAEALKAAGLSVDSPKEMGGAVLYPQTTENIDESKATVVKMSNDMLVVLDPESVESLRKASGDADSVLQEHGFLPSVSMAAVEMHDQLLEAAEAGEDVAKKAEQIIDSFKAYVMKSLEVIPVSLFKADFDVESIRKSAKIADPDPKVEPQKEDGPEPKEPEPPVVKKDEVVGEIDVTDDEMKNLMGMVQKMGEALAEQIKSVQGSLTSLTAEVGEVKKTNEKISTRVGEVEAVAKAAKEAVTGTVVSVPPGDPTPRARKSENDDEDPRSGVFDTAFMVRKQGAPRNAR